MTAAMYGMEPNRRHAIKNKFKKMGMVPGVPDLCLLHDGRAYMFEVKRLGEKLTERQEKIHELLYEINICAFVVSDVEHVTYILNEMGITK